jgi:hypothetical protein
LVKDLQNAVSFIKKININNEIVSISVETEIESRNYSVGIVMGYGLDG